MANPPGVPAGYVPPPVAPPPTNLPAGFTAPAGAVINQGKGAYTVPSSGSPIASPTSIMGGSPSSPPQTQSTQGTGTKGQGQSQAQAFAPNPAYNNPQPQSPSIPLQGGGSAPSPTANLPQSAAIGSTGTGSDGQTYTYTANGWISSSANIAEETEANYQTEVSATNSALSSITDYYNNLLAQDTVENQKDTDATRAMNLASGVAGGGAAAANQSSTTTQNNARTAATTAAMANALEQVYGQISDNAAALSGIEQKNTEDATATQQQVQANSVSAMQSIGAAGLNGAYYQTNDPQGFASLMQQSGMTALQVIAQINAKIPTQYQPSSTVHYAPDANGNTTATVVTSQMNPLTGAVTMTTSQPVPVAVPWTSFSPSSVLELPNGQGYGYLNAQGQLIDLSTGKLYSPSVPVGQGSSLANPNTGTILVKGNDKYSVVSVGSDLNGNPIQAVFDATKGTFLGTQTADGTLAPANASNSNTTAVPGMTLPALTESDNFALTLTRSMPTPNGSNVGYIDATDGKLSQQDVASLETYGKQNGLTVITNGAQIQSLESISAAANDLANQSNAIVDASGNALLPSNWWTADLGAGAVNNMSAYLGSGTNQAAFEDYNLSMLDYIKAITGSGSSGGNSRLVSIVSSGVASDYMPQLSDPVPVAQAKMKIIASDIQSSLDSVLPENSQSGSGSPPATGTAKNGATYTYEGTTYTYNNGNWTAQ